MARPVRPEVRYADMEARRFFRSQWKEAQKLGYPTQAAFAKDIAKGSVSLAPLPEDEQLEKVGKFLWSLELVPRQVVFLHYGDNSPTKVKAHFLGMSTHRFAYLKSMALTGLAGMLFGAR